MGRSVLVEALDQPATSLLVLLLVTVWALLHHWSLGYDHVGVSYDGVLLRREFWRLASSQLSHIDLLHIIFNVSALLSIGVVERTVGTLFYLQQAALLFILSPLICLGLYHLMIHVAKREEYRHTLAVGYSCVIFGWMTLLAVRQPGGISMLPLFGVTSVPMWATPFASLILTSILIPRASFLGHLSGILAGYLLSSRALSFIGPWPALALPPLLGLALAVHAIRSGQWQPAIPYFLLRPAEADTEAGINRSGVGVVRIVNGQIQRG